MRTTLNLDDDLFDLLRREAAQTQRTLREVVNERLRLGLAAPPRRKPQGGFVVKAFESAGFAPGIDENKLNQLVDVLETEDHRPL